MGPQVLCFWWAYVFKNKIIRICSSTNPHIGKELSRVSRAPRPPPLTGPSARPTQFSVGFPVLPLNRQPCLAPWLTPCRRGDNSRIP